MAGMPEGYVDVAERIREFTKKYPEGTLKQVSLEFLRDFGNKDWVVYTAAAYRSPEDQNPGIGTAWEPVPGPTNFTRDSEVQNAETAAWGRAMVAALAVETKKIASSDEVLARTSPAIVDPEIDQILVAEWIETLEAAASVSQLQAAWEGAGKAGVTRDPKVIAAKDIKKKALS
ncbi:MAG TPA: hypothetical protein VN108_00605 [Marmoricola sp.]|nr:hypothetical protein [Marmoricola sp.]